MIKNRAESHSSAPRAARGLSISLLAGALGAAGCGLVAGVDFGAVKPRGQGGAGGTGSTGTGGASATASAASGTGVGGGVEPPPCDPAELPLPTGIFVSPTGNDITGDGLEGTPYQTIAKAMTAVSDSRRIIYLEHGVYPEPVTFKGTGLTIDGGWVRNGVIWARECGSPGKTLIAAPTAVAVTVDDTAGKSMLSNLAVYTKAEGASLPDQAGESLVGVLVRGASSFTLFNVEVHPGDGGNGGPAPIPPITLQASCSGQFPQCSSAPPTVPGSTGSPGSAGGKGTFDVNGFIPAVGTAGTPGGPGANGSAGGLGEQGVNCHVCTAASGCNSALVFTTMAGAGFCGCGGPGGAPGQPGRAGGATIGVLVHGSAVVSLDYALILGGPGGGGSPGADGGIGASATPGSMGVPASCYTSGCTTTAQGCFYVDDPSQGGAGPLILAGGAPGSAGANGGNGGKGGGGAGGPSYGVVAVAGGTANLLPTSKMIGGVGGTGADGAPGGDSALYVNTP